jgi:hypothetical protein
VVDSVNTDEVLVTEYRPDNLNISSGGNAIDLYVSISGSLMPRRWQPHHQDRADRLTPCLFRNFTVFKMSMRRKNRTDYLLTNQCSWAGAGINYGFWRLIELERAHRQPISLKEELTLLLFLTQVVLVQGFLRN